MRVGRVDCQSHIYEIGERVGKVGICQLVRDLATAGLGQHQSTATEASQMVAGVRTGEPKSIGELARVGRPIQQGKKQSAAGRISECPAHSSQGIETSPGNRCHSSMIQRSLNYVDGAVTGHF